MTISALEEDQSSDMLARNFELYRHLAVILQAKITRLDTGVGDTAACKETAEEAKKLHHSLQTVLDLEASLVKRSRSWTGGGGSPLDLGAARAEILARLAVWDDRR